MTFQAIVAVRRVNDVVYVTAYSLMCTSVSEKRDASCVRLEDKRQFPPKWYLSIELRGIESRKAVSVEARNVFVIVIHIPYLAAVQLVLKTVRFPLTRHFLFTALPHTFRPIRHLLRITAFCIRIYGAGRRPGSFTLSCNLFGIMPHRCVQY